MLKLPRTRDVISAGIDGGGACVAVFGRDGLVVEESFGSIEPATPLAWMSSGKPLTAMALGILFERGSICWNDPVAKHIPEFAQNGKQSITLTHLLTHTAGLRGVVTGYPQASWDQIIDRLCAARMEPNWPPGSNTGYHPQTSWFVLGEIVRRIDGRSIDLFVRDEIFEPLGMTTSTIAAPVSPGSSCRGTARDLARFYQMQLRGGEGLLKPETIAFITRRHREGMFDHTFKSMIDFGLGFIINSDHHAPGQVPYGYGPHASRDTFGHGGAQSGVGWCDLSRGIAGALIFGRQCAEAAHQQRLRETMAVIYEDLGYGPASD